MKNKFIILLSIAALFTSCNKVKKLEKEISGNWDILSYTYQNNQGFTYKYDGNGVFTFESCNDSPCTYDLSLNYSYNGTQFTKIETGYYTIQEDAQHYILQRLNDNGTSTTLDNGRVVLVNKDQMKTFFQDEKGFHNFILQKN